MDTKNPTTLACVVTLPCETLLSAKQALNDKFDRIMVMSLWPHFLAHSVFVNSWSHVS